MPVEIEIREKGRFRRIEAVFPYDPKLVSSIKRINGRRWVPSDKVWTLPLDLDTCRRLREEFGDELRIGKSLRRWAKEAAAKEVELTELALADSASLERLPERLPDLHLALHAGPKGKDKTKRELKAILRKEEPSYQCADVSFMAQSDAPCNFNEMGLGKTIEVIGSVFEAGMDDGPQLVIAPKSSLYTVWSDELERWQDLPVIVADPDDNDARVLAVLEAQAMHELGEPFWLVINPGMLTYRSEWRLCPEHEANPIKAKQRRKCPYCEEEEFSAYPEVLDIHWRTVVIDECHRAALGNPKAKTHRALTELKRDKIIAMSGTPFGGKPIKLFSILQTLHPETFTSKWRWADRWLEVEENDYGKRIGGLRSDVEDEFFRHLGPYLLRRQKEEVLQWLPPKQYVDVWCSMTPKQKKQYRSLDEDAVAEVGDAKVAVTGVLDEYTRLKQFANAFCTVSDDGRIVPTTDSGKIEAMMEKLEELGIRKDDPEGDEQVVIFSQFREMVDMIHEYLNDQGIPAAKVTGKIMSKDRAQLQRQFQEGRFRVMVISTTAGGVAINLDRASNVFMMDETWNPDDQAQAEDRCHRASRIHQVTVYYFRTSHTIEELIAETTVDKSKTNELILDVRRRHLKEA